MSYLQSDKYALFYFQIIESDWIVLYQPENPFALKRQRGLLYSIASICSILTGRNNSPVSA